MGRCYAPCEELNEALVRSRTGAMSSVRPQCAYAQGPRFQRSPCVVTHRGHEFKAAPVPSCAGASVSIRPQRAHTQGPCMSSIRPQCAPAQGP